MSQKCHHLTQVQVICSQARRPAPTSRLRYVSGFGGLGMLLLEHTTHTPDRGMCLAPSTRYSEGSSPVAESDRLCKLRRPASSARLPQCFRSGVTTCHFKSRKNYFWFPWGKFGIANWNVPRSRHRVPSGSFEMLYLATTCHMLPV